MEFGAVLYFRFAQVVHCGVPFPKLREVFRDPLREQDVTGVAATHYSLGHVYPATCDIRALVYIVHSTHGPAVNSHAYLDVWKGTQCARDFDRATNWRTRRCEKCQRHPVAGRQADEFLLRLRTLKLVRCLHDFVEIAQHLALIVNQRFRITDYVHEQDVSEFEIDAACHPDQRSLAVRSASSRNAPLLFALPS